MSSRNQTRPKFSIIAAVDVGSNSIKMTVACLTATGTIEILTEASDAVRLGSGTATTGLLAEDRIAAALSTLTRFAATAHSLGAEGMVGVATEAVRRASNGATFLERVHRETGWDVRLLSGDDEAALTFRGLAMVMEMPGNVVVADIGGASTEIIRATARTITSAVSLRLGSGSLTDAFITNDPPTVAELDACRTSALKTIGEVSFSGTATDSLIVTGGTGVYLAMLVTEPSAINSAAVDQALQRASTINAARLSGRLGIPEARARVLPAGITIVQTLVALVRPVRIDTAQSGIRMGLIAEYLLLVGDSPGTMAP